MTTITESIKSPYLSEPKAKNPATSYIHEVCKDIALSSIATISILGSMVLIGNLTNEILIAATMPINSAISSKILYIFIYCIGISSLTYGLYKHATQ